MSLRKKSGALKPKQRVLVVGQTPPPYGGQAIMIRLLLDGEYQNAELFHVRMSFSRDFDGIGRFSISKLVHLFRVILEITCFRIRYQARTLYYPPCGPGMIPMLRDLAILCATRWMFKRTVFHFHAAGISEMMPNLPRYLKPFFYLAYFKPDVAIRLSEFNPDDGKQLQARRQCLVPNGIIDAYALLKDRRRKKSAICTLLYVGLISESKGILVLIEAMKIMADRGIAVRADIVGEFHSPEFRRIVFDRIAHDGLTCCFAFKGVLTGQKKHRAFLNADIFCFPTFFAAESFGLVVAEAMQFGLPVVASRWRGVQSLVVDERSGFLTPAHDSAVVAKRLETLVLDPALRRQMGSEGRQRYLEEYTVEKFRERMDRCFHLLSRDEKI